ncbi:Aminomethyltransferase [Candidatus Methylobacter favarea]|uniref:aminomethyltransferase n=1 Tax=Candidatus Methylobacter favarea TaxID=2707345 RepID=A0A8S0WAV4_9GAMM|nr:glycine cleavage system aminomethyltransferase GcvT [Candidatus Methylobacter favarea]CAA9891109.1 Aminomethyltransferase [Candidatus Methylobacter favarea]
MLKQTPLFDLHLESGAKMVPFAGYQMPVHYTQGIIHEHLHCRSHAGFFDISHMGQCLIRGDSAASELEQLTPSDITGLEPGQQKYTVLTNSNGGIIDDIIVTRNASGLMIIVNAACKDKDFAHLKSHLSDRCHFEDLPDHALFALQGPAAAMIMQKFSPETADLSFMQSCEADISGIKCNISRSGYTGEDGFEISVANHYADQLARLLLAEDEVEPIGLGARDTLRLEAGLCLYGHELTEAITPVEAGLQWVFKKGHSKFPGAHRILDQLQHGAERIRTGLVVDSKIPVREGSVIINNEAMPIGHVTSGSFSPSLGRPIAMALLDRSSASPGNILYAKVREREIAVAVSKLPFIPHHHYRLKKS